MKAVGLKLSYPVALVILYLVLQPNIFAVGYSTFATGSDQHLIVNPIMSFASKYDAFQDPLIRLWNGEFELYHSTITNIRYPFFFLWAGDTGNMQETARHMYLIAHLHHIIGGLGGYVFARAISVKPIAACAGAVFFMFCLNNTLLSPFYWRLAATAWTPYALAGVWLISSGQAPRKGILIAAPAIAMLVFAKSTQPLAYFAYLSFFVALSGILTAFFSNKSIKDLVTPIFGMSALVAISLLLSFPVLYPVMTHASEYIRWTTEGPTIGTGFKVTYEASQQFKYPLNGIWNVLVPLPNMFSIGSSFLSAGAVVAIFTALFSKKHRIIVFIMSFVMVYFVINGFGDTLMLSRLTHKLPLLNSVRQLTSHYIFVVVPATILIAIGFEKLLDLRKSDKKYVVLAGCFALSIVLSFYVAIRPTVLSSGVSTVALILAPLALGLFAFNLSDKLRSTLAIVVVVLFAMPGADLRTKNTFNLEKNSYHFNQQKVQDAISAWEAAARIKEGASVISFVKETYPDENKKISTLQINSLALFAGLRPFNVGYTPRPYEEFKNSNMIQKGPERGIWRGAEFVLTDQDVAQIRTNRKLKKIGTFGQMNLFQVVNPYFSGSLECMKNRETKDADLLDWCSKGKNYANVRATKRSNIKFVYDIQPNGKMFLKHWGWANTAWHAKIDGRTVDVIPVEVDRIAVKVQSGDKRVSLTYMPSDYKYSWFAFWLGLAFLVLIAFPQILARFKPRLKRESGDEFRRT